MKRLVGIGNVLCKYNYAYCRILKVYHAGFIIWIILLWVEIFLMLLVLVRDKVASEF